MSTRRPAVRLRGPAMPGRVAPAYVGVLSGVLLVVSAFIGAAVAVWIAATRLARLADAISAKTGLGQVAAGMILLGATTSLPEIAVATRATLDGVPELSINDLLGSASINILSLAIADAAYRREALTSRGFVEPGSYSSTLTLSLFE